MEIKVLKTEEDYNIALARADEIFDAMPGTTEGDELELLLVVIKDYEDKHHPVPPPDPKNTWDDYSEHLAESN